MVTRVVYAAPYTPPPLQQLWQPMPQQWEGWDGSVWDLVEPDLSGVALQPGVRGLLMPPVKRHVSRSAGVHGTRHKGYRVDERDVFWPLRVFTDTSSSAWVAHDAALWSTLMPGRTGTWRVFSPDGSSRTLTLRFRSVDEGLDIDPALMGWALYGIHLVAEDPFWVGPRISKVFTAASPQPFFPGPPFTVSEGSLLTSAAIANPGDEPAWAEFWVQSSTEATVGVDERVVVVPFEVTESRMLVIQTSPETRRAIEIDAPAPGSTMADQIAWVDERLPSGLDRTRELGAATKFGSVPPAMAAQLSVNAVGVAPRITAHLRPRYHRAW